MLHPEGQSVAGLETCNSLMSPRCYTLCRLPLLLLLLLLLLLPQASLPQAISFPDGGAAGGGEAKRCVPRGGGIGECRELFSCPAVVKTFRRTRPVVCGFQGMAPIVCCPQPLSTREKPLPTSAKPRQTPPKVDFECGRRGRRRRPPVRGDVVGGVESDPNSWPWMAAVGRLERRGRITWFCDGVLITPLYVLSAGHCVSYSAVDLVRLGAHDLRGQRRRGSSSMVDVRVSGIVIHPQYRPPSSAHDISLLRLHKPVTFTPQVSPVCLPWTDKDSPDLTGRGLTLAGWGAATFGGSMSDVLMEVVVTVMPSSRCNTSYATLRSYSERFPDGIGEEFVCAGTRFGGKDACQGDSGGPLVYNVFGRYLLAGVVTGGYGCGLAAFPGLYASTNHHLQWIRDVAFS